MGVNLKKIFNNHFQKYIFLYFLVIVFLMIGISTGAITIRTVDDTAREQIINYLGSFSSIINKDADLNTIKVFRYSITNNIQTIIAIWLLGITVIGVPIVLIIIALRGFIIGFTVAFFIKEFKIKGLTLSLLYLLPQNIFLIFGFIVTSVISILFSISILKNRINVIRRPSFLNRFVNYTITMFIISIIIIIGSLVESFTTPIFLKVINNYLTVFMK
ncbi:stage II sporulation protein M [Caloranaerobacter azorensis]|uniref:Stage II sporulation protein M n=1 Tax=Caloranaerobacter azorensis TaxID=116090 RepID=A0A6P1YDA4_9FIRM|nr:stage II sporulation protein M [Caloranaerobacter azorensis]QIB26026.1 stage II sporulation protein M [Caloranaerobacter azorensis]